MSNHQLSSNIAHKTRIYMSVSSPSATALGMRVMEAFLLTVKSESLSFSGRDWQSTTSSACCSHGCARHWRQEGGGNGAKASEKWELHSAPGQSARHAIQPR